jgi:hypothetical protein
MDEQNYQPSQALAEKPKSFGKIIALNIVITIVLSAIVSFAVVSLVVGNRLNNLETKSITADQNFTKLFSKIKF